jgi:membrane-bound serine protease (ClpP class)
MQYKDLVGQEGVALTTLRPAGMARFGEKKVDVVSEGEEVERDSRVRVIEVKGNRVVVRAVRS